MIKPTKTRVGFAIGLSYGLLLVSTLSLSSAVVFGGDEGFELMKSYLLANNHSLYSEIWSDQPPLHTAILAAVFRLAGTSTLYARLVTVLFAVLLVSLTFDMIAKISGYWVAAIAVALMVISHHFVQLSVSAMIVLPAWSLGIASLWCVAASSNSRAPQILLSGVLMALGLQTKIAAGLFVPSVAWALFASTPSRDWIRVASIWLVGAIATYLVIAGMFPSAAAGMLLGTHFSKTIGETFPLAEALWNMGHAMKQDLSSWCCVPIAAVFERHRRKKSRLFAIPFILLITTAGFHAVHRPYWWYYYLHFSVSLSWLAGIALHGLYVRSLARGRRQLAAVVALFVLQSWILWQVEPKLESLRMEVMHRAEILTDSKVRFLSETKADNDWVLSSNSVHVFHARKFVPPEMAVWSRKRLQWLTEEDVQLIAERYRPSIIADNVLHDYPNLGPFVKQNYDYQAGGACWTLKTEP